MQLRTLPQDDFFLAHLDGLVSVVDGADHSFHVLARSGRTDRQVREELLDTMAGWITR